MLYFHTKMLTAKFHRENGVDRGSNSDDLGMSSFTKPFVIWRLIGSCHISRLIPGGAQPLIVWCIQLLIRDNLQYVVSLVRDSSLWAWRPGTKWVSNGKKLQRWKTIKSLLLLLPCISCICRLKSALTIRSSAAQNTCISAFCSEHSYFTADLVWLSFPFFCWSVI